MWRNVAALLGVASFFSCAFAAGVSLKYPIDTKAKAIFAGLSVCQDAAGWQPKETGWKARWMGQHWRVWFGTEGDPEMSVDVQKDRLPELASCKWR